MEPTNKRGRRECTSGQYTCGTPCAGDAHTHAVVVVVAIGEKRAQSKCAEWAHGWLAPGETGTLDVRETGTWVAGARRNGHSRRARNGHMGGWRQAKWARCAFPHVCAATMGCHSRVPPRPKPLHSGHKKTSRHTRHRIDTCTHLRGHRHRRWWAARPVPGRKHHHTMGTDRYPRTMDQIAQTRDKKNTQKSTE